MAYTSGDTILDDHYNGFATDLNTVWGVGTGNLGYGQGTTVASVAAGNTVTATQWSTLLTRISSAASHQGTSLTAITSPTTGNDIAAFTALSGNVSAITSNARLAAASGTTTTTTITATGSWTVVSTQTATMNFPSSNQARYFFNAGGKLVVDFSRSGGTAHAKNTEWTDQCNDAGQLHISADSVATANNSGGQTTLNTTLGYWNLTATYQTVYLKYADTSPYTASSIKVSIRRQSQSGSDNGTQVQIKVEYLDGAADNSIPSSLDVVDGTLTTNVNIVYPSTSVLSNSWGTVTRTITTNTQS